MYRARWQLCPSPLINKIRTRVRTLLQRQVCHYSTSPPHKEKPMSSISSPYQWHSQTTPIKFAALNQKSPLLPYPAKFKNIYTCTARQTINKWYTSPRSQGKNCKAAKRECATSIKKWIISYGNEIMSRSRTIFWILCYRTKNPTSNIGHSV